MTLPRRWGRRALVVSALPLLAALLWGGAHPVAESLTRPPVARQADAVARGAAAFEGAGFGGISMAALSRNAVPWRLVAAALVLDEQARDPAVRIDAATLARVLARFGFLNGAAVVNRPPGVAATATAMPLGLTTGDVAPVGGSVVRVANLGCAACHAGVAYRPDGTPDPARAVLGMPNTSLDLEAYTMTVFAALRRFAASDRLLPAADALFPDMSLRERATLRLIVLPLVRRRLAALGDAARPLPFPNGTPGTTNGVAALKAALGLPLIGGGTGDVGTVSIPDLGDRVLRTRLLVDGAYGVPGAARRATTRADLTPEHRRALAAITTFFTVPSMGVHPDAALDSLGDATAVVAFLETYRPPPFPGVVDPGEARAGAAVYAQACAACHGDYRLSGRGARLERYPNWIGEVGTDPLRAATFAKPLADAVGRTAYRSRIAVTAGQGYAAPPLTGLWASAPYLHNGSVPTLDALLSPERRPARFQVGGHALDFDRVGLRLSADGGYPRGYRPFSQGVWIDTRQPGRGNGGHGFGADLRARDKAALIAFLKLL
ncbi:hypothetical protein ASG37_00080 [Sphingomonas sp. Leaf407]|uniref:c-type cytochrome n=1 Tax=unclassified Sphingomonas TaxID=196159 RepID=UPI00070187C8|nr:MULTISPECIES: c-type cytochrome [unclassified Sphingomonas]KQN40261.1 hypothetical protein ASE97_00110 [Sphingomonas sp. Leaf42]KQT29615.1 hypothetical protein ASG37_00080 [Sphingomonas sp. Leaf407]